LSPPARSAIPEPGVERAYGSLLARIQLRRRAADRVAALLESGRASKKLAAVKASPNRQRRRVTGHFMTDSVKSDKRDRERGYKIKS
jgi:hypothetical protein